MVLVNTLSCAQPGRACGQREAKELAAPTAQAERTGGQTGGAGRPLSQAKAQNGAAAPVAMERETNNEQTEMQHGRLAQGPHTPTRPLHTHAHTHPCAHAHTAA